MKIEMGESLFYSWLRHVKECQIVQTNWKTSVRWQLGHEDELKSIMLRTDAFFTDKYGYKIYKKTGSLSQLLQQAECDALGIALQDDHKIYAVDVAFHEAGLNYGDRVTTVTKVVQKCLRAAMCIYGYLDSRDGEIIFAAPRINHSVLDELLPCVEDIQQIMNDCGFRFRFRVITNDDFYHLILKPILMVSDSISDTNELFLRSYQMIRMFSDKKMCTPFAKQEEDIGQIDDNNTGAYGELKIGKLAQTVMKKILESGTISEEEMIGLQDREYSKRVLDLDYPLLVRGDAAYDKARYYTTPLHINGVPYMLCSQWFESSANNDRPYLVRWIEEHR